MDAPGLVAVIVTTHELAVLLAACVGLSMMGTSALLLRRTSPGRRAFTVLSLAAGSALLTLALTSHLLDVRALDVEVVRVSR